MDGYSGDDLDKLLAEADDYLGNPKRPTKSNDPYADALRRQGAPENLIRDLTAIGWAESSGNPRAINPGVGAGGKRTKEYSIGPWQINTLAHPQYDKSKLTDWDYNAKAALEIYRKQGLKAWGAYTDGRYKQYLKKANTAMRSRSVAPLPTDDLNSLLREADTFLQEPAQPQTKFDKQGNPVTAIGGEERVASEVVPQPVDEPAPAQYSPYALGKAQEALQKLAPAPQTPDNPAYLDYLKQSGMTDSNESRKAYNDALTNAPDAFRQPDPPQQQIRQPQPQLSVPNGLKPPPPRTQAQSGMVEPIRFTSDFANRRPNETFQQFFDREMLSRLRGRIPGATDYDIQRALDDSPTLDTEGQQLRESRYAGKTAGALEFEIKTDVLNRIEASVKRREAETRAKSRIDAGESDLDVLLDEELISPESYTTAQYERQVEADNEKAARKKFLADNPTSDLTDPNFLSGVGAARFGDGSQLSSKVREQRPDTERLDDILRKYGSAQEYYKAQERIKEEYKYRPLAEPLEFAGNLARSIASMPAYAGQFGVIALTDLNPWLKGVTAEKNPVYQALGGYRQWLEDQRNPDLDRWYTTDLPDGLGQLASRALFAPFTGGASVLLPIAQGAVEQYDTATKNKASNTSRNLATIIGGLAAVPEVLLNVRYIGKALPKNQLTKLVTRWAEKLFGNLAKTLPEAEARQLTSRTISAFLQQGARNGVLGFGAEYTQERAEDTVNKALAKLTYRPEVSWTDVFVPNSDEQRGYLVAGIIGAFGGNINLAIQKMSTSELQKSDAVIAEALREGRISQENAETLAREVADEARRRNVNLSPTGTVEQLVKNATDRFFAEKEASRNKVASGVFQTLQPITAPATAETEQQTVATPETAIAETIEPQTATVEPMVEPSSPTDVIAERPREMGLNVTPKAQTQTEAVAETPVAEAKAQVEETIAPGAETSSDLANTPVATLTPNTLEEFVKQRNALPDYGLYEYRGQFSYKNPQMDTPYGDSLYSSVQEAQQDADLAKEAQRPIQSPNAVEAKDQTAPLATTGNGVSITLPENPMTAGRVRKELDLKRQGGSLRDRILSGEFVRKEITDIEPRFDRRKYNRMASVAEQEAYENRPSRTEYSFTRLDGTGIVVSKMLYDAVTFEPTNSLTTPEEVKTPVVKGNDERVDSVAANMTAKQRIETYTGPILAKNERIDSADVSGPLSFQDIKEVKPRKVQSVPQALTNILTHDQARFTLAAVKKDNGVWVATDGRAMVILPDPSAKGEGLYRVDPKTGALTLDETGNFPNWRMVVPQTVYKSQSEPIQPLINLAKRTKDASRNLTRYDAVPIRIQSKNVSWDIPSDQMFNGLQALQSSGATSFTLQSTNRANAQLMFTGNNGSKFIVMPLDRPAPSAVHAPVTIDLSLDRQGIKDTIKALNAPSQLEVNYAQRIKEFDADTSPVTDADKRLREDWEKRRAELKRQRLSEIESLKKKLSGNDDSGPTPLKSVTSLFDELPDAKPDDTLKSVVGDVARGVALTAGLVVAAITPFQKGDVAHGGVSLASSVHITERRRNALELSDKQQAENESVLQGADPLEVSEEEYGQARLHLDRGTSVTMDELLKAKESDVPVFIPSKIDPKVVYTNQAGMTSLGVQPTVGGVNQSVDNAAGTIYIRLPNLGPYQSRSALQHEVNHDLLVPPKVAMAVVGKLPASVRQQFEEEGYPEEQFADEVIARAADNFSEESAPVRDWRQAFRIVQNELRNAGFTDTDLLNRMQGDRGLRQMTSVDDSVARHERDAASLLKSVSSIEDWDSAAYDRELDGITLKRNEAGQILAPNGKVSKIQNERLAKVIRSKAFKDWFGDWEAESIGKQIAEPFSVSQVKDENGEPLVVYHGGFDEFEVFDRLWNKKGFASYDQIEHLGSWFTDTPNNAEMYGRLIMPVFLNVRHPVSFSDGATRSDSAFRRLEQEWKTAGDVDKLRASLNGNGFDAVQLTGHLDSANQNVFIVLEPNQIKSIFNRGSFSSEDASILKSVSAPVSDLGFYSAVEQAILDKMPNKAGVDQVRSILNPQKSPVKQEELDWLGLDEFLSGKQSVTKQELLDFVRANNVQLEEIVKGGLGFEGRHARKQELIEKELAGDITDEEIAELDWLESNIDSISDTEDDTKFADYQLEGDKENYRELLLTLPTDAPSNTKRYEELSAIADRRDLTDAEQREMEAIERAEFSGKGGAAGDVFRSEHFDEPNILAHVRLNERTDADGKRVLFVEEVQSDWLQALRQGKDVPDAPFKKSWHELAMKRILRYAAENGFDKVAWTTGEQQNDRYDLSKKVDYIDAVYSLGYANEVTIVLPNTTLILTLNKDGIVTDVLNTEGGALPAEMEGRPLDEIIGKDVATRILEYRPDPTARAEQLESLFAREKAAYRDDNDELAKELYEQRQALMAETPLAKRFEGNDLKLGGTGMKGFYDKIIPSFVNKYAKKWGAKVGTTSFDTGDYKVMRDSFDPPYRLERRNSTEIISRHATAEEAWNEAERLGATIVHAVDITPSMRESVMAGQPLFAKRDRDRTARLNETLPYETELHKVVENIESKFDDNGELELNEYASETIRRVLAEISNDPYETSFDGVTIPQATARKIANRIRGRIKAMDKAGYDVAPITQLVENLDKLATAKPFGIVYVFDDVLPEERVHVEDLTLGRTDSKAIAELKQSPIWAKAQSGRFSKEYGNQSEANQISEIAAKLATDQSAKYGWTGIDNFEAEKTKFLNTWADGVLRGNESTIEEIGAEAFIASYPTIGKYGKVKTGDTKGTGNQRTSASADETRTAKEDDSEKQTQADERSDRDTEAAQSDTDRRLPADGKLKKRQFAVSMAEQLFDIGDVEYEAQTEKGWSEKAIAKVEELGTDKAIDEYRKLPANESAGNKTALGIGIAIDLYQKGDFKQLTDFGRELTENIGNAAQELRAAALLSRLSPVFAEAYAERIVRRNLKRAATEEEKTAARVLAEKLADLSNKVEITQAALEQQTAISKDLEDAAKEIEQMLADERGKVADEKRKNRNLTAALKRAKDATQRIKTPRTRTPAQNKALRKQIEAEKASLMDIIKRSLPGNVLKMVAWHGSPHLFDRFDIGKVGTGEGAQSYGWGLYFTSQEDIAAWYKDKLTADVDVGLNTNRPQSEALNLIFRRLGEKLSTHRYLGIPISLSDALDEIRRTLTDLLNVARQRKDAAIIPGLASQVRELASLKESDIVITRRKQGAKYKVDLKPAEDEYLLWDKPLSEQSEKVKKALAGARVSQDVRNRYEEIRQRLDILDRERKLDTTEWDQLVEESRRLRRDNPLLVVQEQLGSDFDLRPARLLYENIGYEKGQKEASEYLKSLGIRGIKYLDGNSRSKGEGAYNYVIFDDADVEITDILKSVSSSLDPQMQSRYDELLTMTAGGERRRKAQHLVNDAVGYKPAVATLDRGDGIHAPADPTDGAPAWDLTGNGQVYPDDVYSSRGLWFYGTGENAMDARAYEILQRLEGRSDAPVKIYRAVEKNGASKIIPGDWVTIDRRYALEHGQSALNGDYKIISKTVYARDIFTSGDSWLEWGYHPQPRMVRPLRFVGPVEARRPLRLSERRDIVQMPSDGSLKSVSSSLDPQLRDAYVKLSAAKMIDEFGKPLVDAQGNKQNDPFTLVKFDEWLDGLAQQSLSPDDRAEIHAMAYEMIRPQRQTIGMDASQRTRNRMEHAKAARKIIPDQQADAIKDREAYRRDKFAQAMVETARDMGATPEETYMAFGIRELGDKRRLEPEFKREFPDANFDKTLLAGENIYKETKARLDRARIEMREGRKLSDKELFDIKHADKLNRGAAYNARRDLERYYRELAKSTGRKAADRAVEVLGLPKTLMSTGEVSFALRQGFIPFLLFNKEWREGTKGIVKGMSDPTKRIAYEQELRDDPYFTMAEHYGVAFNQIGNRARIDEHFPTKFIEDLANADTKDRNIAAVGAIKAARLQQRFEHAYTLPGDAMRLGLFKNLAQVAEQSITDDPAKLEQAYKYAAYIANISVGKGSVEKVFGTDAMFTRFLNTIGFAPGYLMSRIEAGFHYSPLGIAVAYSRGGAGMAKQMARKSMRMYGSLAGAAILMQGLIAGVSGAGDGDKEPWYTIIDPSSPNFMKLRWPNGIKTDITANLSDWGKLFLPNFMASGWHAVQEAAGNDEAGFEKAVDVWGKDWNKFFGSWRYWRGKLSPTASTAAELYDGKTYLGRPITPWGMITSRTAPLTYQQAYDAFFYDPAEQFMREPETFKRGVDRLMDLNNESLSGMGKRAANSLTLFGLAGIGIGAQQYERFERSPAEEKAASIYGEIAGGGKSSRKSDEQRRIEAGLRDLFRYRDQLADKGKDTQWVTDAIKRYAQKYNVPADVRTELKDQAQTSSLKFYTQRMTAAQVREVLKYATFEEQSELLDIIKKKESNEEKRKAKGAK